jgi:hypothetical protein
VEGWRAKRDGVVSLNQIYSFINFYLAPTTLPFGHPSEEGNLQEI